ncbi:hypothetical protein L0F63_001407, partial [Massospora cicadina]
AAAQQAAARHQTGDIDFSALRQSPQFQMILPGYSGKCLTPTFDFELSRGSKSTTPS